ncbi:hypothetical protein EV44_g3301 [Erysiphe necator]|uniref:Reverse transcriptase Ty1/copia-type domain-containing protein n=1 Tax=Uncinula necator TaxID=52586 RepID=A0A0B1P4T9_UNCNE|nr:hypothetical protein EV44_g3301 [Erysiphe necator]
MASLKKRFVDDIKHRGTEKEYAKSRLVVQMYKDDQKNSVLTQSPTLQRVSQRIILALAAMLPCDLFLRDITQAYVQSTTNLSRDIYVRPPPELGSHEIILKLQKPLYGVPEAGNHWLYTYYKHLTEKLSLIPSTFDPCLLCSSDSDADEFGVVGLQTDDTLFLANQKFADKEENEIKKAKLIAKDRKPSLKNLKLVQPHPTDILNSRGKLRKASSTHDQFVAQRARGAYIASVCQPEASFDLSFAAQAVRLNNTDINSLNKRLKWQLENSERGLRYVELDKSSIELVVFTDSSFANNKDFSSQIGFVVVLKDKENRANILHLSSTKCKRVTRSVLATELYALVNRFDSATTIKSTLERILCMQLPLIICTDSKSLYDCLVKLGTTRENRLMIDVICLREAYEKREIAEIRWIKGQSNPADDITKSKCCNALRNLIDTNSIFIETNEWVERSSQQ